MAMQHNPVSSSDAPWWRRSVVYQVYIRSFADGNGDGCGDITGLLQRLDYLDRLGVDALWINPWYPSPLKDGGYDVADYRDIEPQFGTLAQAEELIASANAKGIKIIVDLVPNHTSDAHEWFVQALASAPESVERDRYVFRRGTGLDATSPPTDWQSVFGGPAWTAVDDGWWYLHLFDTSQPDLNWENPEVRDEFESVLKFWLDRGVDGFRIDVAHGLVKDQAFPDIGEESELLTSSLQENHPHWDRDGVHEIIRGWRSVLDQYQDKMMVAEAWVRPERLPLYLRPDEYHQSFNFDLLEATWTAASFRGIIDNATTAATAVGASSTWVLSNHDVMRHVTRYGLPLGTDWRRWPVDGPHDVLDVELGVRRARAAILITLALPGTAYIYQGEELGLPEVWDLPLEVLDDPVWERSGHTQKGRDGCRVPVPWERTGPSYGFGSGEPWLPQPAVFGEVSAAAQENDQQSMLALYRTAIATRRANLVQDEQITLLDMGPDVLAFERGSGVVCITNFGSSPVELPTGQVLVTSVPIEANVLPADAGVWILT